MPFPSIEVISGLIKVAKDAADIIGSFRGDDPTSDTKLQDAIEVFAAVFPLIDTFGRGNEVTAGDARVALAGLDTALDDLDKEIARQSGNPAP